MDSQRFMIEGDAPENKIVVDVSVCGEKTTIRMHGSRSIMHVKNYDSEV